MSPGNTVPSSANTASTLQGGRRTKTRVSPESHIFSILNQDHNLCLCFECLNITITNFNCPLVARSGYCTLRVDTLGKQMKYVHQGFADTESSVRTFCDVADMSIKNLSVLYQGLTYFAVANQDYIYKELFQETMLTIQRQW